MVNSNNHNGNGINQNGHTNGQNGFTNGFTNGHNGFSNGNGHLNGHNGIVPARKRMNVGENAENGQFAKRARFDTQENFMMHTAMQQQQPQQQHGQ